jgi:hypothetical protein
MKRIKIVLLALIVGFTISSGNACDQCGCSVAGSYNNVTAYAHNNYVMLKSSFYKFTTGTTTSRVHSDMFATDLIVGYNFLPSLHVLAYLPYKVNNFSGQDVKYRTQGLGDGGLLANYVLATNNKNVMATSTFSLSVKGGIELPTGDFIDDYRAKEVPANISNGSETIDFMTGARYIFKKKNTTLISDYTFKYNTENEAAYRFGNQHSVSLLAAQRFMRSKVVFTPYAGVAGEFDGADFYHTLEQHGTTGESVFLNTGLEVGFSDYILGCTADLPLYANFGEAAASSPRVALRLAYLFNN